jgi:hypothetical protein
MRTSVVFPSRCHAQSCGFGLRAIVLACLMSACAHPLWAETKPERTTDGLLGLYTFEKPDGGVIRDRAEAKPPLDLRLEKPQGASFRGGKLIITESMRLTSVDPATKIITAIRRSGGVTIEAWVKPQDNRQAGPARIVTLSANPGQRNFTLAQDGAKYDVRLRTTATDGNGIPSLASPEGSLRTELTHIVYTRESVGMARIYLDGKEAAVQRVAGDLSNWSGDFRLSLANEMTGDRPWLGELHLVAIYGRALSAEDVARNTAAGVTTAVDYAALLPPASSQPVDFIRDVQPLLRKHCFECHAAGNDEGGLNLGMKQRAFEGGHHGPAFEVKNSAGSRLIHLVAALDKTEVMPPDGPRLTNAEVGLLRGWIDQGAVWPDGADVLDPRVEQARQHWAFQPLRDVAAPMVQQQGWAQTPIDRFILARWEAARLQPQPRANARQLVRRVHFDLIGLPPTPNEVRDFMAASERDPQSALVTLVERLLQSPHYGERWGRHWLDVARYADSDGQESDHDRPLAYRYRDFVIQAFNDDLPFDQFLRWQLAGDEYEPQNPAAVAATGFLLAGPHAKLPDNLLEDERLRERYNELDDMLSTIGTGMLGLTLGCARCHDHKYDAIPARDYYRLMAALHSGGRAEVSLGSSQEKVWAFRDSGADPKPTWLFRRADFYDRQIPVQVGFVSVLTSGRTPDEYWQQARRLGPEQGSTNQRRALAEWLTDVDSGAGALVARVIVNRLWQQHFGQGLVRTASDFGVRAEPPSHPELLEWLARDLVRHGWKLKRLHQLMMTSAVYQQASAAAESPAADPDNRLLWKMPLRRLEAEILRDSMLAVSGTLNPATYGPAVKPPIAAEAMLARNLKDPYPAKVEDGPAVRRRSVYLFHKRVVPNPMLQAFDKPDAQQSCGRRDVTTVAPQALALMNDQFVRTMALEFADRLLKEAGAAPDEWIEGGYRLALGRSPSDPERAAAQHFLDVQIVERTQRAGAPDAAEVRRRALADFCQTLFSLNEFLYID